MLLVWNIQNQLERSIELDSLIQLLDEEVVSKLSSDDIEHIHEIEMRIEAAMSRLSTPAHGAFVRLSTRSPKDSALSSMFIRELIRNGIESHELECPDASDAEKIQADLNIFTIATCFALKVSTAKDALNLLMHSQRVFDDIMRCDLDMDMNADSTDPEDYWDMKLVVREWWPALFPPFEFRCFVYDDFMTSITQYYSLTYYAEVIDNKDRIQRMIVDKWSVVHPLLCLHSYTIDFAISWELDAIMVVEINHLPPSAGTSLFDFNDVNDRSQIERGFRSEADSLSSHGDLASKLCDGDGAREYVQEVEMRVNVVPLTSKMNERDALCAIDPVLRAYIDEVRGRLEKPSSSVEHNRDANDAAVNEMRQKMICAVM